MFEMTYELAMWVVTGILGAISGFLIQYMIREYREMASVKYDLEHKYGKEKMKSLLENIYSNLILEDVEEFITEKEEESEISTEDIKDKMLSYCTIYYYIDIIFDSINTYFNYLKEIYLSPAKTVFPIIGYIAIFISYVVIQYNLLEYVDWIISIIVALSLIYFIYYYFKTAYNYYNFIKLQYDYIKNMFEVLNEVSKEDKPTDEELNTLDELFNNVITEHFQMYPSEE